MQHYATTRQHALDRLNRLYATETCLINRESAVIDEKGCVTPWLRLVDGGRARRELLFYAVRMIGEEIEDVNRSLDRVWVDPASNNELEAIQRQFAGRLWRAYERLGDELGDLDYLTLARQLDFVFDTFPKEFAAEIAMEPRERSPIGVALAVC